MEQGRAIARVHDLMAEFADQTGLAAGTQPQRYLWTDAFAVCNYLSLHRHTGDQGYLELARRLVGQVHQVLGRHRPDDPRHGWISGLPEEEGAHHPTIGGLRIGKELPECPPGAALEDQEEWDRDGQYYHYLTKWMHALNRFGRVTSEADFHRWAKELARTAHACFTHVTLVGGTRRLYWKMSVDLTRPLVTSMGLHDPLDGLITFCELQETSPEFGGPQPDLDAEIAELAGICDLRHLTTEDPLGTGGLLFDAVRGAELTVIDAFPPGVLESVVDAALGGLEAFAARTPFRLPAACRLPFRELGLAIGLKGVKRLRHLALHHPEAFDPAFPDMVEDLGPFLPWGEQIEEFWLDSQNREGKTWREHRNINLVMLATSLAPVDFLAI